MAPLESLTPVPIVAFEPIAVASADPLIATSAPKPIEGPPSDVPSTLAPRPMATSPVAKTCAFGAKRHARHSAFKHLGGTTDGRSKIGVNRHVRVLPDGH